jgi:hypothetical protein
MSTKTRQSTAEQRWEMARFIFSVEARKGKDGKLRVYKLRAADGGGTFEVAGINDRYHPEKARELAALIRAGKQTEAEREAIDYLATYTDVARKWTRVPALEAFLRDCAFNRGPKGALRILQLALKVADDGRFGPVTKGALTTAQAEPGELLLRLRAARGTYERRVAPPVGKRAAFWEGLTNRWNQAEAFARGLL